MKQNKIPKIMEEMSKNFKENEKLEISLTGNVGFGSTNSIKSFDVFSGSLNPTTTTTFPMSVHIIEQKLLNVVVNEDEIEHIYKRVFYNPNGLLNNQYRTEVFKKVFGRKDGSEKEVIGTYIPEQPESYVF